MRSGREPITWVLQAGAFSPSDFTALADAISRLGCRLEQVRIVPFSHEAVGRVPQIAGDCIVYGSSGMVELARRCGWRPAGWDGPAFSMRQVIEALGPLALNADAVFTRYSAAAAKLERLGWDSAFIKPDAESKEFAGEVHTLGELRGHVERLSAIGYFSLHDNPVLLATPKQVNREWRAFVVEGEVLETSLYAVEREPRWARGAPDEVVQMARRAAAIYAPAPVFVVDIAELRGEPPAQSLRVAEYNSFNSSGFYACNIERIVAAVTAHVKRCG